MLKCLSSEYQLYASGKKFSQALTFNENHHFAKGSDVTAEGANPKLLKTPKQI
jgi:hypothetical protein